MSSDLIQISDVLFSKVGKMITETYGIKMATEKKIMFQSRLQKRLRELKLNSFDEYAKILLDGGAKSSEFSILVNYISTNKTEFFRENNHFIYLNQEVFPSFNFKSGATLNIWSAGCSSGQEAYTIALVTEEFKRLNNLTFNYSIIGTDISTKVLLEAKSAIYKYIDNEIPKELLHMYFLKSKNTSERKIRVIKSIRDKVFFTYLNLIEDNYKLNFNFDIIYLRNTLIYFDSKTQQSVLQKVISKLKPGGYLFIGHSESLINMNLAIHPVAPSVYVKV